MTGMPLFQVLSSAYPPQPVPIKGVPQWARTERFDISATASLPEPPTTDQEQLMMQALLADRFKLAAHFERAEGPVFNLVLARTDGKLGPGLTPLKADCVAIRLAEHPAEIDRRETLPLYDSGGPPCRVRSTTWSGRRVEGDFTMASLAKLIQTSAGRPVVDRTGLTGSFRVQLEAESLMQGSLSATSAPSNSPSIFSALPDQLGLKLESSRAMVETLVIDRIERPSEN